MRYMSNDTVHHDLNIINTNTSIVSSAQRILPTSRPDHEPPNIRARALTRPQVIAALLANVELHFFRDGAKLLRLLTYIRDANFTIIVADALRTLGKGIGSEGSMHLIEEMDMPFDYSGINCSKCLMCALTIAMARNGTPMAIIRNHIR